MDYSLPPDKAKEILQKISDNHPMVLRSPASIIRISSFEENCIKYEWVNWQHDFGKGRALRGELQEQLWYALQREVYSLPLSIRDVRITKNKQQPKPLTTNKNSLLQAIHQLLRKSQLFSILFDEQIQNTISMSSFYSYVPGEIIVKENEPGDSLFMLINGHVAIRKPANSHEYLEIAQLQRGDIFGEMTVFTGTPRSATIQSISKVDILEVKREAIADLFEEEPGLIERFGQLISDRQDQLAQLTIKSAPPSSRDIVGRIKEIFQTLLT